jgi:flagellar hook-associated protein 1 FlgK
MGSTFGGMQVAVSGMSAARTGIETAGNNIANSGTAGYTRQRVNSAANPNLPSMDKLTLPGQATPGQGVSIVSVERLGNEMLASRLRSATGDNSYASTVKDSYSTLESSLNEPSDSGISSSLQSYWSSWQDLANTPDRAPAASALIAHGNSLASGISAGYTSVSNQWDAMNTQTKGWTGQLNTYAEQLGAVNAKINEVGLAGGSANELMDNRDKIALSIADLSGGSTRILANGTAEVSISGNLLVSGSTVNKVQLTGATSISGAASMPVSLEWTSRPGSPISLSGGKIGAGIDILAPANATGSGGSLAEAAQSYNALAIDLAAQVNTISEGGQTASGATGVDFFGVTSTTAPPALSMKVIPTNAGEIATGAVGSGPLDGSNALKIGKIASQVTSPDQKVWGAFVSHVAGTAQTVNTRAATVEVAHQNAVASALSNSSVDLSEENVNLLQSQAQFKAAARALTAIDEMLDTIINKTGTVGR